MKLSPFGYILVLVVFVALNVLVRQYFRTQAAKAGKAAEYTRTRARMRNITQPVLGVLMLAIVLFNWNRMPPENHVLAAPIIAIGAALILYGIYNARRAPRT